MILGLEIHLTTGLPRLDLAIKASPEGVDVKGYLDPSVLTTGQTSACL